MTEPGESIDAEAVASLEPDEVAFDQDLALGEDGEEDVAQQGYAPNDRPMASGSHALTAEEQHDGSTLDERVAAERPELSGERTGDEVLPDQESLDSAVGEDVAAEDIVEDPPGPGVS